MTGQNHKWTNVRDDQRSRLGYVWLNRQEEMQIRETIKTMAENGVRIQENVGGRFARLAVLAFSELYRSGKLPHLKDGLNESDMLSKLLKDLSQLSVRGKR